MQINFQDIEILCGDIEHVSNHVMPIFADVTCDFLSDLSERLLHMPKAKDYPDVITYAFFCRKANIRKLKQKYNTDSVMLGRGVVFHIAPSNIPINFAYTLTMGLLAGNVCIVKASSKDFPQTRLITDAMGELLQESQYSVLKDFIHVVIYSREHDEITAYFSERCNIRVIWGGDATIANVRKTSIPSRAFDITFADRYSMSILSAGEILQSKELAMLAKRFYNDTYLYDQNACSSPRLIYWIGNKDAVEEAQTIFWNAIYENIDSRYQLEAVNYVDKYVCLCEMAVGLEGVSYQPMTDNRITRVKLKSLTEEVMDYPCKGGLFLEYAASDYDALKGFVTEKLQTVSYYGIDTDELRDFIVENGLKGVDRIVPIGQAVDFNAVWDGYDLIRTMARHICNI